MFDAVSPSSEVVIAVHVVFTYGGRCLCRSDCCQKCENDSFVSCCLGFREVILFCFLCPQSLLSPGLTLAALSLCEVYKE